MKAFAYITACVLAVIAIGIGASASRWDQKLSQFDNELVRFNYPSSWTADTFPKPDISMFSSAMVSLSNEAMHAPCVRDGSTVTCSLPLTGLGSGGVLVVWSADAFPGWTLAREPGRPVSVNGHAGKESSVSGRGSCVIGTQEDITLVVARIATANYYEMDACLRGPDLARERSDIQAMIASTKILRS